MNEEVVLINQIKLGLDLGECDAADVDALARLLLQLLNRLRKSPG